MSRDATTCTPLAVLAAVTSANRGPGPGVQKTAEGKGAAATPAADTATTRTSYSVLGSSSLSATAAPASAGTLMGEKASSASSQGAGGLRTCTSYLLAWFCCWAAGG
jgi:hypothetical protein